MEEAVWTSTMVWAWFNVQTNSCSNIGVDHYCSNSVMNIFCLTLIGNSNTTICWVWFEPVWTVGPSDGALFKQWPCSLWISRVCQSFLQGFLTSKPALCTRLVMKTKTESESSPNAKPILYPFHSEFTSTSQGSTSHFHQHSFSFTSFLSLLSSPLFSEEWRAPTQRTTMTTPNQRTAKASEKTHRILPSLIRRSLQRPLDMRIQFGIVVAES